MRSKGKPGKHGEQKIQRTENAGKGRESGGKGRTLKIEVQILPGTCPKDSKRLYHGF
jgi:hypothetical protein